MEILINREPDLELSWHPNCIFQGTDYVISPIKSKSLMVNDEEHDPTIPKTLQFHIGFKNKEDVNLYKDILEIINDIAKYDQIKVIKNEPKVTKEKVCLKKECKKQFTKTNKNNKKTKAKYDKLVNKMRDLGCRQFDFPDYGDISNQWFEWKEYIDTTSASISVCCHSETHFYKFLQRNNMLEKYFPEWYKPGNF
jgi:hypothetical protein